MTFNYAKAKFILETEKAKTFLADGTICTPFPLVDEILDKLDLDWSNPALTFLDPACGRGTFLVAILNRLLEAGHSQQWVVENMLFGVDIEEKNATFVRSILGAAGKYRTNIECCDALMKDWNMKFDVVVGNPPFNDITTTRVDGLSRRQGGRIIAKEFIDRAIDLSTTHVVLISSVSKIWSGASKPRNLARWLESGLYEVTTVAHHFGQVDKSLNIGCFFFNRKDVSASVVDAFDVAPIPSRNLGSRYRGPKGSTRTEIQTLISNFVDGGKFKVFETAAVVMETNDEVGFAKIQEDPGYGSYRVVFSKIRTDKIGRVAIANPEDKLSSSAGCVVCDTLAHAVAMKRHLESDGIVNLAIAIKDATSDMNSKFLFERLPDMSNWGDVSDQL